MDYSRPELADRLAAGYVLGTLRGPARRRFEALLPAHAALRGAVRGWQDRLMPLSAEVTPVPPSPQVWKRIEARIGGAASTKAAATAAPPRAQLAFWRGFAALASVAAVSLAVLLANPAPTPAPILVVLSATAPGEAGAAGTTPAASFVASISGDGRKMVTRPLVNVSLEANRALELWAVPASGAPRSLGLISASGATVLTKDAVLKNAAALAVSLEPPGGSPTGAPTGPILYVGKLTS
jgi:anti-sigma-K factor RskA